MDTANGPDTNDNLATLPLPRLPKVKNARKALSDAEAANRAVLERALAEAPPEVKRDSSEEEVERGPFTDEKPAFVVTCKRCGGDVDDGTASFEAKSRIETSPPRPN